MSHKESGRNTSHVFPPFLSLSPLLLCLPHDVFLSLSLSFHCSFACPTMHFSLSLSTAPFLATQWIFLSLHCSFSRHTMNFSLSLSLSLSTAPLLAFLVLFFFYISSFLYFDHTSCRRKNVMRLWRHMSG